LGLYLVSGLASNIGFASSEFLGRDYLVMHAITK